MIKKFEKGFKKCGLGSKLYGGQFRKKVFNKQSVHETECSRDIVGHRSSGELKGNWENFMEDKEVNHGKKFQL